MTDKQFIEGLFINPPHESAPDFVLGSASFDLKRFFEWAKEWKEKNPDEKYLKISMKVSREGRGYAEVDTWKPEKKSGGGDEAPKQASGDFVDDSIPF